MRYESVIHRNYKDGDTGWANASKDTVLAMDAAGIDIVPRALKLNEAPINVPNRILELEEKSSVGCDICIQNVLPHHLDYNGRFKKNIAYKGSKLESHWKKSFKDVIFQDNLIYAIKQWKPTYVLDDGTRIKYTHQMFHLL